jgi:hypothetical protein
MHHAVLVCPASVACWLPDSGPAMYVELMRPQCSWPVPRLGARAQVWQGLGASGAGSSMQHCSA